MITLLFLVTSHNWPPSSPNILLLSLTENAGGLDHFRESLSFPGSHPCLQEVSMLLIFYFSPANMSFIQGGGCSAKHLEWERENDFSSPKLHTAQNPGPLSHMWPPISGSDVFPCDPETCKNSIRWWCAPSTSSWWSRGKLTTTETPMDREKGNHSAVICSWQLLSSGLESKNCLSYHWIKSLIGLNLIISSSDNL